MKTEDLIRTLAADLPNPADNARTTLRKAMPAGLGVAALLLIGVIGLRAGLAGHWQLIVPKLLVTLALASAAFPAAIRLMRPEPAPGRVFLWLGLPVVILLALMGGELWREGSQQLVARMIGRNSLFCLAFIPFLSLAPLAAFVAIARKGAVTAPGKAGFLAGLAAAGIGASLYALHCTDDSLFFVALWYSLGAALTAGLGMLAFRLAIRW